MIIVGLLVAIVLVGLILWGLYCSSLSKQEPLHKPKPRIRRVK